MASGQLTAYGVTDGAAFWTSPTMQSAWLLVDASATRVSAYANSGASVDRYRIDTSSATGPARVHVVPGAASCDTSYTNGAATRAGTDEFVLCGGMGGDGSIRLRHGGSGDGTSFSDLTMLAPAFASGSNNFANVGMDVADPSRGIDMTNPLGVVWMQGDGNGATTATYFAEITSLSPLVIHAQPLPGSVGFPLIGGYYHWEDYVDLIPAPDHAPGHWFAAAVEPPDSSGGSDRGVLRVWELSRGSVAPRLVTVPSGGPARITDVSLASAGPLVRMAGQSTDGLATWSVGCH